MDFAESHVNELNRALPGLKARLGAADLSTTLGPLNAELHSWLGDLLDSPFSFSSYEDNRVDDLQRDVDQLAGRLQQLAGQIEPEYQQHAQVVQTRIAARRRQLEE